MEKGEIENKQRRTYLFDSTDCDEYQIRRILGDGSQGIIGDK